MDIICRRLSIRIAAFAIVVLAGAEGAHADINPWIKSSLYDPAKWDSAGPKTATRWLHPRTWTPGQDWGWLSGKRDAPNVTGSWGGLRDRMFVDGLSFGAAYVGQLATNPVGGETSGGISYIGSLNLAMFADIGRLRGTGERNYFTASVSVKHGDVGLSPDYVGNYFPVQLSSSSSTFPQVKLVHVAYGAQLFDNKAEFVGGRLLAGDDFATLARACTSLNQDICGNPFAGGASISFPSYPNAAWGARVKVQPGSTWYAQAGTYLVYPEIFDAYDGGVQFGAPDGSGLLTMGEVGFYVGRSGSDGKLPGTYKFGGYYDAERLTDLGTGASKRGTWGAYVMGEQMLYREAGDSTNGLWGWLALSYAPPDVNEITFMAAGGLSYVGLLPQRPHDSISFIAATGVFSDRLDGQTTETILEFNYRMQVVPALFIEPDVQYVIQPNGDSSIDNAWVVGFAVGATF